MSVRRHLKPVTRALCSLNSLNVQPRSLATSATPPGWLQLYSANGSPYTRKVMSALRYKHVPFTYHQLMPGNMGGDWEDKGLGHIKPQVIPVVKYANGDCQNDSTFILEKLDSVYPDRPIIPSDPVQRFLAILLEDMFDEWGTKIMFGIRWQEKVDQIWSARYLLYDSQIGRGPLGEMDPEVIGSRQVSRMAMVGCDNPDMVRRSLTSLASAVEAHLLRGSMFLLGSSPTIADFALYGQLSQVIIDRSGDELIRDSYPALWAWIRKFEDLSGVEGEEEVLYEGGEVVDSLLQFTAQVYLPFLRANSSAIDNGEKEVKLSLWADSEDALSHSQPAFRYQHKCYQRLRQCHDSLGSEDKEKIDKRISSYF